MKKLFAYVVLISGIGFASWGVGGCGGAGSDNPPDVSGLYALTNTDCPGEFDSETNVVQDGADIIFQATHDGFLDISGSVDNNGNIDGSTENATCSGEFINGVITGICKGSGETCQVTYTRE